MQKEKKLRIQGKKKIQLQNSLHNKKKQKTFPVLQKKKSETSKIKESLITKEEFLFESAGDVMAGGGWSE